MRTVSLNQYFGAENAPPLVSTFDLIDTSRKCLSKKSIAALAKNLELVQRELLVILNISVRTWQRYSSDYNFLLNPSHPRMAEVKIIEKQPFRFDHRLTRP